MTFYFITVVVILGIGAVCLMLSDKSENTPSAFLKEYGWDFEDDIHEKVPVKIPEEFDDVYKNYNELQLLANLDLSAYKGKEGTRFTYIARNFPDKTNETVYLNVICIDGVPVAGDVMTVSLDGFMYSLNYLNIKK